MSFNVILYIHLITSNYVIKKNQHYYFKKEPACDSEKSYWTLDEIIDETAWNPASGGHFVVSLKFCFVQIVFRNNINWLKINIFFLWPQRYGAKIAENNFTNGKTWLKGNKLWEEIYIYKNNNSHSDWKCTYIYCILYIIIKAFFIHFIFYVTKYGRQTIACDIKIYI